MNLNHANTSQHFIETIESGIHLLAPGWVAVRVRGAMIACQGPRSMSVSPFPMAHQAQATSSMLASLDMLPAHQDVHVAESGRLARPGGAAS